jgi:glutamine synthetase
MTVLLLTPDTHGSLRGKAYSAKAFDRIVEKGHTAFPDFIFMVDPASTWRGMPHPRFSEAFGDILLRPDPDTKRELPWRPGWSLCLGTPLWADGEPCDVGPRVVLQQAVDRLARLGLSASAAFEYEAVLRRTDGSAPFSNVSYAFEGLASVAPLIDDFREAVAGLGIDLSVVHTEDGPGGGLEMNMDPRPAVVAADEAILLRTALRDVAPKHDMQASFLAKSTAGIDGCGGHVHVSLWRDGGENAFTGAEGEHGTRGVMGPAVAGLLEHMVALSPVYLPTMNSYKRLVPGHSAPVNATWGHDNRLGAVRAICKGGDAAVRLEFRLPGADANPYLVLAAVLSSMAAGIESGSVPPPPATAETAAGDAAAGAALPTTLESALLEYERSPGPGALLGDDFARYFAATRRWELDAWQESVTEWEIERGRNVV